ncbi:hypothetical protein ACSFEV_00235 [Pseudomonas fulva]|uniref:hypothetical protein n=1 Tax=Pseudomonas fulva TaxID=47880 RepID=UPI003EED7903
MNSKTASAALILIMGSIASPVWASPAQAINSVKQGKAVWEFYESAVADPAQITLLSIDIEATFQDDPNNYKDLNNKLAEHMGWFKNGTRGSDLLVLHPEPSPHSEYGRYSITFRDLSAKECRFLASYPSFKDRFDHLEVNQSKTAAASSCKSKLFGSDENVIKFVSR